MEQRQRSGTFLCLIEVALFCLLLATPATSFRPMSSPTRAQPCVSTKETLWQRHMAVDQDATAEKKTEETIRGGTDSSSSGSLSRGRGIALATGLASLASVSLAAKVGLLQGLPLESGEYAHYTDAMILRDAGSAVLTGVLAAVYTKSISWLAAKGILEPTVSRKLIHTFAAPLFVVFWPIYTAAPGARFFAATVTLVNMVRLFLAAQGDETELAEAVSRSGDLKEVLGGPFLYVVVITASILAFWRSNLVGVMAISIMAAGDGAADLVGRRFGRNNKWFFSEDKSVAGSVAFVTAGALCAVGLAAWLSFTGCLELTLPITELAPRITAISLACAVVELLPVGDDNWTVPLSAALLSMLFL